jgi:thiol-disulfide isomerase/thioredoxin
LITEYRQHLPVSALGLPDLSPQEVARFLALGEKARREHGAGDFEAAAATLRHQLAIATCNPEPYADLALVSAARGDGREALSFLRDAVVRGLPDLDRFQESPRFRDLTRTFEFQWLKRIQPHLSTFGGDWSRWGGFQATSAPASVEYAEDEHAWFQRRIEDMTPVLGPRLAELWLQWLDFATAALLEQYASENEYAPDLQDAVAWLFRLYSEGESFRWTTLSRDGAVRLARISRIALERFPEQDIRADAWVAKAIARYSRAQKRQGDRAIGSRAARDIENSLELVIRQHPDSPRRFDATLGLILVAAADGRREDARDLYLELTAGYGDDADRMQVARDELGDLNILLGGLPTFEAFTPDGTCISPSSLRGKVVLLDFWATWCGPCLDGLDRLRRLHDTHAGDGLVIVGLSLDHHDDLPPSGFEQWTEDQRLDWTHVYDGQAWESDLVERFGVREIPFTVLIAADGTVLETNLHGRKLERAVASAMAEHRKDRPETPIESSGSELATDAQSF